MLQDIIITELLMQKKYAEVRELLCRLNAADVANILYSLPQNTVPGVFRLLPKSLAADTFVELDASLQELLVMSFGYRELVDIIEELYLDDAVDILEEMPANVAKRILAAATSETRAKINELLRYPDGSAGSLMTVEYVKLAPDMSADQALEHIRRTGADSETIYTCYVTDPQRELIGVVTVKDILLAGEDACICDIMERNVIYAKTLDKQEHIVHLFEHYDFLALPVVDTENRLVGIITVDDVIDVIQKEAEEDFAVMAAITPSEEPYLKTSVISVFLSRIPWLMLLMLSATFTGLVISSFENALAAQVVLTSFIPMLMDTGGNSGSQASVTIIRALSNAEIAFEDIFRILLKELRISLLCAASRAPISLVQPQ